MALIKTALIVLISIESILCQEPISPVVTIQEGDVQGTIKITPEGRSFYAFRGIPFGKAPVGDLRFKPSEAIEPWSGVFQADSDPPLCIQISSDPETPTVGIEDCLQLSVYTPILSSNSSNPSLPVNAFIHGGAYVIGNISYDNFNPVKFMNYNMVVVVLNYRLGPIGFLSTNDEAASGNYGLYDQNLALKWVQRNIAVFGGNPNDVTLTGQSVGGVSTLYHVLSPMSAGLFHRAISESGSPLMPWAVQENALFYATEMAEHFNCSTDDTSLLIDCLRQLSAEEIVGYTLPMMLKNITMVFVPVVETIPNGFITEDPLVTFESGNFNQVPLQLGFNRDEGCLVYDSAYIMFQTINDTTFDVVIPTFLYSLSDYRTNLVNISYAIKDQYYTGVDYENQTAVNIATIAWMSDIFEKSGVSQTAVIYSSHNLLTYFYAYNYVSSSSTGNFTGEPDINHSNELQYLWYRNITDPEDAEFGDRFFHLWVEFIINGTHIKPSGSDDQWLQTPPGQYNYYDINKQFIMRGNYDTEDMNFWWNTVPSIAYA